MSMLNDGTGRYRRARSSKPLDELTDDDLAILARRHAARMLRRGWMEVQNNNGDPRKKKLTPGDIIDLLKIVAVYGGKSQGKTKDNDGKQAEEAQTRSEMAGAVSAILGSEGGK